MTLTGVDKTITGRATNGGNVSRLGGIGYGRKAVVGTTDEGQMICIFYAREQRMDRVFSFMDVNGFCNYAHMN